jgi:CheY-like chemotaxis protein
VRILIVDDDAETRSYIMRICPEETKACESIGSGLRAAKEWQPEVILLDVHFANEVSRNGLDAIPDFLQQCPQVQIIVVTDCLSPGVGRLAILRGAFGAVGKGDELTLLATVEVASQYYLEMLFSFEPVSLGRPDRRS